MTKPVNPRDFDIPGANRETRILLTGTYNSLNKGDAAMQIATAAALRSALGESANVAIYSPFPALDAPFHAPVPVRFDNRRQLVRGTVGLLASGLQREFSKADLVVDLSGDMLTEDYGPHVAWSHFLPLLRALRSGTPYVICAQSIGPFKLTTPIARTIMNRAAAVTVRDAISLDYLASIGVSTGKVRQTADMAFLLPRAAEAESRAAISDAGLDPAKPFVAISVSRLVAARHDRLHGAGSFTACMAEELAALADAHSVQLLFVAHVTGPSESKDDRVISREVLHRMERRDCALLDLDARPELLKGVIGLAQATIGCRMHANIASLSSNVPVLALAYSHKTPGIMQACGLGEMVVDIDRFDRGEFRELANRLLVSRTQLASQMQGPVAQQKAAAGENVAIVTQALAGPTK